MNPQPKGVTCRVLARQRPAQCSSRRLHFIAEPTTILTHNRTRERTGHLNRASANLLPLLDPLSTAKFPYRTAAAV